MDTSQLRTYTDNYHKMHVSNDTDRSDPQDLCSLGVVDLDLSLSPDAFVIYSRLLCTGIA